MNRVIHFEIQADDVQRAQDFYAKVLGWKFTQPMKKDETGGMDYWLVETGQVSDPGINGGMYKRPEKEDEKYFLYDCTIEVPDIDAAVAAVKANGGTITREKMEIPKIGWFASAKDTEGNRFALMQPTGMPM